MIPSTLPTEIPNVSVLATEPLTNELQPVRHKVKHACGSCKERKVRCDGQCPCKSCVKFGVKCEYVSNNRSKKRSNKDTLQPIKVVSPVKTKKTKLNNNTRKEKVDFKGVLQKLYPQVDFSSDSLTTDSLIALLKSRNNPNIPSVPSNFDRPLILPPKQIALNLISKTWDSACLLFRFYHRPTFINVVESFYTVSDNSMSKDQVRMLPLIYSVIAVGALFSKTYSPEQDNKQVVDFFQDEGHKYFVEAKSLLDPINSQDIESLQAIFMLTIFLQCNANLSSGYSYIGLALRSAIKHNFHRKTSLQNLNVLQQETIKRLFWTIYKTDIYMNCILGLPNSLDGSLIDQEFPMDIDDDKIFFDKVLPQPKGKLSSVGMNNEHTKLILIMNHTHNILYPMSLEVTSISHKEINKLESQLSNWLTCLPYQLKPNFVPTNEQEGTYLKPNRYLHLDFLHAKIMIYRPFIHYIVLEVEKFPNFEFQIHMADKCINTARKVIRLAVEMDEQKLLNAVYWFSIHTIFFSVACLLYFLHQTKLKQSTVPDSQIEKDCRDGFNLLLRLKNVSHASSKTFEVLNSLFEKLNQKSVDLSDKVLKNIIAKQQQHEYEQFSKFSDLFIDNDIEDVVFEEQEPVYSTTDTVGTDSVEVDNDFINKILSQFCNDII